MGRVAGSPGPRGFHLWEKILISVPKAPLISYGFLSKKNVPPVNPNIFTIILSFLDSCPGKKKSMMVFADEELHVIFHKPKTRHASGRTTHRWFRQFRIQWSPARGRKNFSPFLGRLKLLLRYRRTNLRIIISQMGGPTKKMIQKNLTMTYHDPLKPEWRIVGSTMLKTCHLGGFVIWRGI